MKNHRRTFMLLSVAGAATLALNKAVQAQTMLAETDPQAVALGYKSDTTKVDKKKYPKHDVSQKCTNCTLYQGKSDSAAGGCSIFGTKQVAGPGWCSAWAKKAG